ncbi:integrase [Salmonella enterica subsp. enterica serovar Bareilly]|nr:integrase [Salmonella enterica subsp. enterica serovar Bareilly]EAX6576969.1 integrase [Salmonella enterica]ECB3799861.1 integrase [Salmonella enterica subsp. enterica serovar Typhimurium]EAB8371241.1 integrase [Salmonella enterica subsp. enterica serovar Bareilly]EBS1082260.1 integrase [Salmonella enterica subsp. enterica serovar Bareilly]
MRKYITPNEWLAFFDSISGSTSEIRDKPMFLLAYQHGLRVSELTGLRINDLDLDGGTIFIKRLKNSFSTTHPLQIDAIILLKKWLKYKDTENKNINNDNWLFVSKKGQRLSRQWVYKLSQKYSLKAKIPISFHPHMLRHACGYALADQGLDTRLIQDYLGHRNIHHTVLYTASNSARFSQVWRTKSHGR